MAGTSTVRVWHYTIRQGVQNVTLSMGPDVAPDSLAHFWRSSVVLKQLLGRNPADMTAFAIDERIFLVGADRGFASLRSWVEKAFLSVMRECQQPDVVGHIDFVLTVNFIGQTRARQTHAPRPLLAADVQRSTVPLRDALRDVRDIMAKNHGRLSLKQIEKHAETAARTLLPHRLELFRQRFHAREDEIYAYTKWYVPFISHRNARLTMHHRWFQTVLLVLRFEGTSVRLRQRQGASEGSRGFCIEACLPLKAGDRIQELMGFCPSDTIHRSKLTDLSVVSLLLTTGELVERPLLGPLRFINHSCKPNCAVSLV